MPGVLEPARGQDQQGGSLLDFPLSSLAFKVKEKENHHDGDSYARCIFYPCLMKKDFPHPIGSLTLSLNPSLWE